MATISSEFPFDSKYITVLGSKIHYVDQNPGMENQPTFVCVHGNPTSSYLWRNIIPYLIPLGRVIALDLIGFGKSDKPILDYRISTHQNYFDAFIDAMELKNIVFVLHDWGTALGLSYARKNEANVKAVAFMEGIVNPKKWDFGNFFVRVIFRAMRSKLLGKWMVINRNFFVNYILLLLGTKRTLTSEEKAYYREPFNTRESRFPTWVFPNEIPINGHPKEAYDIVKENHRWAQMSTMPKLLLWVKPGVLIKAKDVKEMQRFYPNLELSYLGKSSNLLKESHFVQEDFPDEIGNKITSWYKSLNPKLT